MMMIGIPYNVINTIIPFVLIGNTTLKMIFFLKNWINFGQIWAFFLDIFWLENFLAIGIDDMFIMNASWDQTDRSLPIETRMAEMMADAGVAVSITNITDILSFAIGCITSLPGIFFFSSYAFTSVLFCYVFQVSCS